ncbi:hypothetical protein JB92DRAFT_3125636 [Gautieria morchelliformis]|nr:hypothetical protein JB92DRAFT_3125636 [Gautieria morchelliformis]
MKRVAESQLTKDNAEDGDDSQEPTIGIQKAEPSELASRPIRGLPKRGPMAAATTSTAPTGLSNGTTKPPEPASRFSGFAGFGSSSASAFTFTPPVPQANTTLQTSHITSTPTGKPFQSASMSTPAKGFSFVSTSNPTPPSTPTSASDPPSERDAAHKYCLSLRGINISFLDAISLAVQADPFVDIAEMLEKYKSLRSSAQKEFDDSSSTTGSNHTSTPVPSMKLMSNPPSMPAPPKSSFAFGKDTRADVSAQSPAAGFTPILDISQKESASSSFPWPSSAGSSDKPAAFATSKPLAFGDATFPSGGTPSSEKQAPSLMSSPVKDDAGSTESKTIPTPDTAFEGQGALQGKAIASSPFSFKPSTPTPPLTPGFSSFLGTRPSDAAGVSASPLTKSSALNPLPPSPSGFGFGTGKSSGTSNPFSFGKGSIGNPVGFAFGSPSTTPNDVTHPATSDTSPESGLKVNSEATDAALSTPSHDPSPAPSQGSAYDADGPGEEDEVTLHESRVQAYKMVSTGDTKGWVSAGRGQLKLKGRADEKRRILMRNSNTGQIILNFSLFPGFKANIENNKSIIFRVPGEGETATVYRLRVSNDAEAVKWQQTIQKEVDSLLPSHET